MSRDSPRSEQNESPTPDISPTSRDWRPSGEVHRNFHQKDILSTLSGDIKTLHSRVFHYIEQERQEQADLADSNSKALTSLAESFQMSQKVAAERVSVSC